MRRLFFVGFLTWVMVFPLSGRPVAQEIYPDYLDSDVECMIAPGEKVYWTGAPSTRALTIQLVAAVCTMPLIGFIVYKLLPSSVSTDKRWVSVIFGVMVPLSFGVHTILALIEAWNGKYVITDKRVIIKGGIWNRTTRLIDFTDIKKVEIHEGILERFFGLGSIYIDTGEKERYEVVQKNQKVKRIKKRYGPQMIEDEVHEEEGPDIIRERERKVFYILAGLVAYPKVYKILQQMRQKVS